MAATDTRLLVLGAVQIFEPVNGYQLRRELLTWGVDSWAHIKPGSIYSGLTTLTKRGLLTRHTLTDREREVDVYTTTKQGRAEFVRLWQRAVETVDLAAPVAFHTAITVTPLVTRTRALKSLKARLALLAADDDDLELTAYVPPHARKLGALWARLRETERAWLAEVIDGVERGEFDFKGDAETWLPPADDPGWSLEESRRRYAALIASQT